MRSDEEEQQQGTIRTARMRSAGPVPGSVGALAVSRVRDGTLPPIVPTRLLAGPGQDHTCSLCGARILAAEVEYEVIAGVDGHTRSWWFHINCYDAWVHACRIHIADDHDAGP